MKDVSYSLGVLVGANLAGQVVVTDMDLEALSKGLKDVFEGADLEISVEEASQKAQTYLQEVAAKKQMEQVEMDQTFMKDNAQREGVTVTASGLQYEVLVEGNGAIPKVHQKVEVHYEGRLINGKVFDSSIQRGQTIEFPVNGVIKGWQEALQLMPVGSKWRLFIPSNLAYGQRGAGNDIPPNASLIFEVELIDVKR